MFFKRKKTSSLHTRVETLTEMVIRNSPGMRVIKTAIAVFLCLMVDKLRGASNYYDASIAAMVCLQSDIKSTARSAFDRTMGTIFSGVYTMGFLWIFRVHLGFPEDSIRYFISISIFVIPLMYMLVKLKRPGAVLNGAIVFLLVCVVPTAVEHPTLYVTRRVINTISGILIALLINWLPWLNRLSDRWHRRQQQAEKYLQQQEEDNLHSSL